MPPYAQLFAFKKILDTDADTFPTGFSVSIGSPQNNPIGLHRNESSSAWNFQSALLPRQERGWSAVAVRCGQESWLARLLLTTHGRILCESALFDVLPGLSFIVQTEDCSAEASGTATFSSSSNIIRRLAQGPCAILSSQYDRDAVNIQLGLDAVNGPTIFGSAVFGRSEGLQLGATARCNSRLDDGSAKEAIVDWDCAVCWKQPDCTVLVHRYVS